MNQGSNKDRIEQICQKLSEQNIDTKQVEIKFSKDKGIVISSKNTEILAKLIEIKSEYEKL